MSPIRITRQTYTKERVLLWRDDRKEWDVGYIAPQYIGNPYYAYTHYTYLPEAIV